MEPKFTYTRCSKKNGISLTDCKKLNEESKKVTPLYFIHKLISRKILYGILGMEYNHKDNILVQKMVYFFRSNLHGEKVFFVESKGTIYLFEKTK